MKNIYYLIPLLLLISCCSSSKEISSQDEKSKLDYNIIIGQGGGFTGNQIGFYIDTLGVVKSFNGRTFSKSKMDSLGSLSNVQKSEINISFKSIINSRYNQVSNMTSYLVLTKNEFEKRFSWEGTYPDKNVPSELTNFYQEVTKIINELKK
jgi:hypothetical protein